MERIGIPKESPEFAAGRRLRLCAILREAKRTLKLSEEERKAVVLLCQLIEKNTHKTKG